MPDLIRLNNLVVRGHHGANPGEKDEAQDFIVNIEFEMVLTKPGRTDDLNDTANYGLVHAMAKRVVQENSFSLLERLATEMVDQLFEDRRIMSGKVSITKPNFLAGCTPEVVLKRTNPNYQSQASEG